jgi:hypothetical protein
MRVETSGSVLISAAELYDRYAFHKEKKQAFESLAELVEHIVNPADNVVPIRQQS